MPNGTHEQTINSALGEVLSGLHQGWTIQAEKTGHVLKEVGRPDILIQEPAGWPVVIEAEVANHQQAEKDARARLGSELAYSPRTIESVVALVYPEELRQYDGGELRSSIETIELEFAVISSASESGHSRFPSAGWLTGGIKELAMLVRRINVPAARVEELAIELENGVNNATGVLSQNHPIGSRLGERITAVLNQRDDEMGQSRKMAMTVITNALVFHAALAEAQMSVEDIKTGSHRPVISPRQSRKHGNFQPTHLLDEWAAILEVNYWPVFHSGGAILRELPTQTAVSVLDTLWETAESLIAGGVTKSHDLTGIVFQRLIADRKFLATYYTRPAAAVLLAGLALPLHQTIDGEDWGDAGAMKNLRIGDFACGTGTLLSSAYQRLSLLHELHGGDPKELHRHLMKNGLVGLDVLNVAVHLTAAMLAGSHPDTPFDGECLLTMPYGKHPWGYSLGSLDLLSSQVPFPYFKAAATTAGGKGQEEVQDLIQRVGHGYFQLVIMNPPFTRHGAREGFRSTVHNPAFAAFEANEEDQNQLAKHLRTVAGETHAHGHPGLASHFVELAHRKAAPTGRTAMVLPMSSMTGMSWQKCRSLWSDSYTDILVVSIAESGTHTRSFSADTGMAECLFIAAKSQPGDDDRRALFAVLREQPKTALEGDQIAQAINRVIMKGLVRNLEDGPYGGTRLELGDTIVGEIINCPIPEEGSWPMVGISDMSLGQTAFQVSNGRLWVEGMLSEAAPTIPVVPIRDISETIGPHHLDISGATVKSDGLPQGPFEIHSGAPSGSAYPTLWNHDAKRERSLIVLPDSHGQVRQVSGRVPPKLQERAAARWATATRAHYNLDLQFNSQSLISAVTDQPSIGGRAWPSVILIDPEHVYAFSLWCNSTLGLICHWWSANPTQSGRGTTTITSVPFIPTLDLESLSPQQHANAKDVFQKLGDCRLLPFDQIDEDQDRALLDRLLVVDVLGLDPDLCEPNGPIDNLRKKLAAEPQIHGGKKSRVVFTADGEENANRDDRE